MTLPNEGNSETILLVEHHPVLLKRVRQILEDANFNVISANSAKEAMRLEAEFPGTIDLLLCDVMVVGTSGPKLAERLKDRRPQIRTALMAGYPGGALLVLNYGWHSIEKPLVASVLVHRIKDILRGEAREQNTNRFNTLKVPRKSSGSAPLAMHPFASRRAQRRA
jgi:DNA-binding NtrC family response regulator